MNLRLPILDACQYNMGMITVSIQAGGESRRMGQNKALMPFLGQPLIQRSVTRMRALSNDIIVITNQPASFVFLELPLFPDIRTGRGALGGLYTALYYATQPLVVVIGCDMPFANPELLAHQAKLLENETADAVIPLLPYGYEPLHAVYRRATCLPAVEWALDNDQWKLTSWFSKVKVQALSTEECLPFDPHGLAFANVNTPQELAEAELKGRSFE